eukprot:TRINITY_DN1586_c0_g1_i1.p1 TRINITY_DN1586_c0_g1~~TRINITY_DN1586_c0_g1_i1.p1  ORF type:complete len:480 (+),score=67.28 TRINITY_DN1586_c0_g1_i1:1404-2843(+)
MAQPPHGRKRAEPFKPISTEESARLFQELDRDGSGHLCENEVQLALQRFRLPATNAAVEDFLSACTSGNTGGRVTQGAFHQYISRKEAELLEVFRSIDTDGDGRLTVAEVQRARKQLGLADDETRLRGVFGQFDSDNSGGIDFAEWRQLFALIPSMTFDDLMAYWERTPISSEDVHVPDDAGARKASPYAVFFCGGVAGAVSRTATAPLDRLKTLLVLQGSSTTTAGGTPRGLLPGLKAIYSEGGIRGFYRGNLTNVLKICPENGVKWIAFERFNAVLKNKKISENKKANSVLTKFLAGSSAGMLSQFCVYPLECIKTRLSAAGTGYYTGILDCATKTLRIEGIPGFYRGLSPAMFGMIPYAGVDLTVYASLKEFYQRVHGNNEPSSLVLLGCGVTSCVTAQFFSFPLGLVRSRLQAQGMSPDRPVLYKGAIDCFRKTYQSKGIPGLYDGLGPTLLKVVPAAAISYVAYENCKRAIGAS